MIADVNRVLLHVMSVSVTYEFGFKWTLSRIWSLLTLHVKAAVN